jgi:hypothetical protein
LVQELRGKQALAALLVLTVLVCHGAYGAMHQVMAESGPAMQGHFAQVAHAGNGETASGGLLAHLAALLFPPPLTAHAGDGEAAGVLAHATALIFVSVVTLWLLIGIPSRRDARPRPSLLFRRLRLPAAGRCAPPPTACALQVFRL